MASILIVDDEADIRELLSDILKDEGYSVQAVSKASSAIEAVSSGQFSSVILDIWLEGSDQDGIGVLKNIMQINPDLPVIMISGHGNIETAVHTIRLGAYDFIEKPFKAEKLKILISRAVANYALVTENATLRKSAEIELAALKGKSKSISNVIKAANTAASSNSRVIISGEDGTGKEGVARYIHQNSARSNRNFSVMNTASLTPANFEEVMFGAPGQYGLLSASNDGTIYINELMHLDAQLQNKLLAILQDPKVSARFIAASSYDLQHEIESGKLSQSLYYRLNVLPIILPSLRDRKDDIPDLVELFSQYFASKYSASAPQFTKKAMATLQMFKWPGNIRHLRNVIESVVLTKAKEQESIDSDDLPKELSPFTENEASNDNWLLDAFSKPLKEARDLFELNYLSVQLEKFGGNFSKTAAYVGMDRTALHRKIKALKSTAN